MEGRELPDQRRGRVDARQREPPHPAAVRPQEARRLAQADLQRDLKQLAVATRSGHPDPDRQQGAAVAHAPNPGHDDVGLEADLADDVGRHRLLLEHRLDGGLVADHVVALRVARDPDLGKALAQLAHRREQGGGGLELAGGLARVPCDHEDVVHPRRPKAPHQPFQVTGVAHEAGRDVRRDRVAGRAQPLHQLEGRVKAPAGGGGDRELDPPWHVRHDVVHDPVERQDLVAGRFSASISARRDSASVAGLGCSGDSIRLILGSCRVRAALQFRTVICKARVQHFAAYDDDTRLLRHE